MAFGETVLTMVGNIVSELTRRTVANGSELVSFWMRSNERRLDRSTGEWVDGRRFAVKVTCWRKLAVTVHSSLGKGDPVIVSGRLHTSEYEVDGQPRSMPELEAVAIGPNLGRCSAVVHRTRADTGRRDSDVSDRGVQPAGTGDSPDGNIAELTRPMAVG